MDIDCVCFFLVRFNFPVSSFFKNEIMVPFLPPGRLANSSFIYCCCGVMRYALYSRRFSKKLFTSQYIQNRSHLGLKKICQAIFFIVIVIMLTPQFNVISQASVYHPSPQRNLWHNI
ncbi:unnamed protein product [Pipistrellus nathusii]|uniref:Uncharacterized protein n=1 Tax=Pipistrellus nathusii TaxID=59473 RepID=A0ABN9ZY68_PIPNA